MRTFIVCFVVAAVGACGSSGSPQGTDGGSDGSKNPCEGLGCASFPGKLTLRVLDSQTMTPIEMPTFTEMSKKLVAVCSSPDAGADGGSSCAAWEFANLWQGAHTISVEAMGYQPSTVQVMIKGPAGCCGQGPDVDQNVLLMK
jgi:hypothetical protein